MRKIWYSAILGALALLLLPGISLAQRGGRGGHGGGYSGGYGGGYYGGHGGYYGGYGGYGGYYGGGLYGGYYGRGYGIGIAIGSPGYYSYGSPYYGSSYSYSPSYGYVEPSAPTTSLYTPPQSPTLPAPTADNANSNVVNMEVRVPENATLWVQGQKTDATGAVRRFVSAPIEPGHKYAYELRATWTDANGTPVDRKKKVDVQAGAWVGVDFNQP